MVTLVGTKKRFPDYIKDGRLWWWCDGCNTFVSEIPRRRK